MRKLLATELLVIQQLVYVESFHTIQSDTGLQYGELRDDLINLYDSGYIEVFEDQDTTVPKKLPYFDSDRPQLFSYRATKSGLDAMKRFQP